MKNESLRFFLAQKVSQQFFSGNLSSTQVFSTHLLFDECCFSIVISHWTLCFSVSFFEIDLFGDK